MDQKTQVNLALREITDRLLKQNKDLYSPIPPIRKEGPASFLILIEGHVNYAKLKSTIDSVLNRHQIRPDYRVSLLECQSGEITLGFLARAEEATADVPCQAREQNGTCYNVRLTLLAPMIAANPPVSPGPNGKMPWLLLGLFLGFPIIWWQLHKGGTTQTDDSADNKGWQQKTKQTAFHPVNQSLQINQQTLSLTYREAKLLNHFFEQPNLVLERESILQAVWEDEGVIVGRSLDVFVSRLRKKIKEDPDLNIINVHGVGYRLEVQ